MSYNIQYLFSFYSFDGLLSVVVLTAGDLPTSHLEFAQCVNLLRIELNSLAENGISQLLCCYTIHFLAMHFNLFKPVTVRKAVIALMNLPLGFGGLHVSWTG